MLMLAKRFRMKQNATRIYNRALFYLQRFSATEKHLETVLLRQLENKKRKGDEVPDEAPQWVRETVANASAWAWSMTAPLPRAASTRCAVRDALPITSNSTWRKKACRKRSSSSAIRTKNPEDELQAALRFVERRRLAATQPRRTAKRPSQTRARRLCGLISRRKRALEGKD
jgi:hypothetical protein